MTMKSELDDLERESYEGTLPERPEWAGEDEALDEVELPPVPVSQAEELEVVAVKTVTGALLPASRASRPMKCDQLLTPLLPAQERIRAVEEERNTLEATLKIASGRVTDPDWSEREQRAIRWMIDGAREDPGGLEATVLAMLHEHATVACDAMVRLERLRGVVRAARDAIDPLVHEKNGVAPVFLRLAALAEAYQALTPEDRAWAEGEPLDDRSTPE